MSSKPKITHKKISDYKQDPKNFNTGTAQGDALIEKSIDQNGAGRSLLAASDGTLIAGNKSQQKLIEAGIENVIEVETDGTTAVVVKRTDIKPGSKEFSKMALADNQSSLKNTVINVDAVVEEMGEEEAEQWGVDVDGNPENKNEKIKGEEALKPYYQTHVLLSFSPDVLLEIEQLLEKIKNTPGVEYEQSSN